MTELRKLPPVRCWMLPPANGAVNFFISWAYRSLLTEIDYPGAARGGVKERIADFLGIDEAPVFALLHDTGSGCCCSGIEWRYAFLSSGTWSLMGVGGDKPIINEYTLEMELYQ